MSFIETERLLIRPWEGSDAEGVGAIYMDPQVVAFTGGVLTTEELATFVPRRLERQARGERSLNPVVEKVSGDLVGVCGLQPLSGGPLLEIGWKLARVHWGKGYASEAARAVLDHAHVRDNLRRIVAVVNPNNRRSIAVVNRLGLHYVRITRAYKQDLLCYESVR